jgi:hypothetical protein
MNRGYLDCDAVLSSRPEDELITVRRNISGHKQNLTLPQSTYSHTWKSKIMKF